MAQRSGAGHRRTGFASDSASRKLETGTRKSASEATVSDISSRHRFVGVTRSMDIVFASRGGIGPGALVVGILDGGGLTAAAAAADEATGGAVKRALGVSRFKGQAGHSLELLAPAGVKASRIVLAGLGKAEAFDAAAAERLAATVLGRLLVGGEETLTFALDLPKRSKLREADLAAHLALGASLRSYRFDHYRKVSEDETITGKSGIVAPPE